MLPDAIRTPRMLLRPWRLGDAADVFSHAQDEAWGRYLPGVPHPYTDADAERFIATQLLLDRERHRSWAMELDGRVVGGINLRFLAAGRIGEFGYSVATSHWRRGLATEAARSVIATAFASEGRLERVQASSNQENIASIRVLEKLGMSREGVFRRAMLIRGQALDQVWYGWLREEWEKSR